MAGYWREEFNKISEKAIRNFAALYAQQPGNVQLMMLLDKKEQVEFHTCIGRVEKEKVKFIHIYHKPGTKFSVDGMTFLIPKMITIALRRLFEEHTIDPAIGNVLVQFQDGEIYMFLMEGTTMKKLLTDEEILTDEQVMADQAKLQNS